MRAATTFGLLALALALPARALGLLDAYALAAAHDPVFQAARASRDAGQENIAIGRAGLLPQVALSYQRAPKNRQTVSLVQSDDENRVKREYSSYAGTLSLTQPLFDLAAWARWKQAGAYALMADEQFRGQAQDLARRLVKAYTDALFARDQLALARAQQGALAQQLERNRRAFAHGDGTRTDIAETEARLALAEVQVIDAQDAIDAAQRALQALTGAPMAELQRLDALPPDFAATTAARLRTPPLDEWQAQALAGNADLAAQRQSLEASRQEVRRQEAEHWPTLKLFLQHSRNESDIAATYNQRYRTNSAGVVLNVPLYSGGGVSASARQAAHQYDSARHTLDAKTDEVLLDLRRQHRLSDSGPSRIAAGLQAVRAAEVALEGNRRGVAVGERINLDVLNAEQQLFTARRDLARAIYDTLNARLALRWRAGTLGEDDLREMAGYFAPVSAASSSLDGQSTRTTSLSPRKGTGE